MEVENTGETFTIRLSPKSSAELAYHVEGNLIFLDSTYTPEEFRGKGVGAKLVEAAIHYAKENGLRVVPVCPFAIEYFKKHPEHNDILAQ
ncbi:MAG: GNAT family N-acetyltransferase [Candidatus Methanosuratincola sp.]|jgi:predicted GNAT family acetyltransferase|nr:GNAT family N-acetyltransferase [Candidatus Methanosuratincola sp.]